MSKDSYFYNGLIFYEGKFIKGGFTVSNDTFSSIEETEDSALFSLKENVTDLQGAYVIPGLVDIHIHGAFGNDFSDGDKEGLLSMASYLAGRGITSFLPTTMTLDEEQYIRVADVFTDACNTIAVSNLEGKHIYSGIAGMRMEGPFLSPSKKGSHAAEYLRLPDLELYHALQTVSENRIRIIDLAPELDGSDAFIKAAGKDTLLSLGHTEADYSVADKAFATGAKHVTHLFNAMRPLHHREPALIGALFDHPEVTAEIIGDGIHVHPSMIRLAYKMCRGRICLISDALRCMGMPDGKYNLAGQIISLSEGAARLKDGTLAGAATDLFQNLKNIISMGIPVEEAILSATETPAKVISNPKIGRIKEACNADFLVLDKDFNLQSVYLGGCRLEN